MPHEIHASVVLHLPDDVPKEWASALGIAAQEWSKFLAAVEPLHAVASFQVAETKVRASNGAKRSHKRGAAHAAPPGADALASLS